VVRGMARLDAARYLPIKPAQHSQSEAQPKQSIALVMFLVLQGQGTGHFRRGDVISIPGEMASP